MQSYGNGGIKLILSQTAAAMERGGAERREIESKRERERERERERG